MVEGFADGPIGIDEGSIQVEDRRADTIREGEGGPGEFRRVEMHALRPVRGGPEGDRASDAPRAGGASG